MIADNEIQQSVLDERRDEPSLEAATNRGAADKGVVTWVQFRMRGGA